MNSNYVQVIVEREKRFSSGSIILNIFIDGQLVGSVKNGQQCF